MVPNQPMCLLPGPCLLECGIYRAMCPSLLVVKLGRQRGVNARTFALLGPTCAKCAKRTLSTGWTANQPPSRSSLSLLSPGGFSYMAKFVSLATSPVVRVFA